MKTNPLKRLAKSVSTGCLLFFVFVFYAGCQPVAVLSTGIGSAAPSVVLCGQEAERGLHHHQQLHPFPRFSHGQLGQGFGLFFYLSFFFFLFLRVGGGEGVGGGCGGGGGLFFPPDPPIPASET